jgi:hypothetical protein
MKQVIERDLYVGSDQFGRLDHSKRMITLAVISLSGYRYFVGAIIIAK